MHDGSHIESAPPPGDSSTLKKVGIVAVIVALLLVAWGIWSRHRSENQLADWTRDQAEPTVTVVQPKPTSAASPLILPGNIQALNSAAVFARTNGYVRKWFVDIGSPVKTGQLLAVLDAPEVEQQLYQAQADLQTAKANENLAATTATRWQALQKQDAVSKQETDERTGDYAARRAATNSAAANVGRLKALIGFTRIEAPFAGIVTSRSTQIGQLVTAGSASSQPLFTVSDISRVRIYVRVPQAFSGQIKPGLHVVLTLPEYAGRAFDAVLTRTAEAVDQQSGTVLIEAQAANPDGALKPGAYAQVKFPVGGGINSVQVPASAILYRSDGTIVAVVDQTGHVKLHPIVIGRDNGDTLEIASGLSAQDRVIDSPPDSIANGEVVRVAKPNAQGNGKSDAQGGASNDQGGAKPDAKS